MRFVIASDLHGSAAATRKVVERAEEERADEIILLGDIYNHGPRNPFPEEYAPMKVAEILNGIKRLTVIKGNCDSEVDEMISDFTFSENACFFADGVKFFFTHGHKYNKDNPVKNCDVLVYGHFHIGFIEKCAANDSIVANPGSAALPKDGTPASYLLFDNGKLSLKNLETGKTIKEVLLK